MAISRERLKELIKQEATIYYPVGKTGIMSVCLKDIKYIEQYFLECYENKEEAEFVAKNHDTRTEKFEPPFELKKYGRYIFISKKYGKIYIERYIDGSYSVCDDNGLTDRPFDTYQEAVDYAHKLFKGEE